MAFKRILAVAVGVAVLLLSGCAPATTHSGKSKVIAASFYPVYIFTLNIIDGVDDLSVECMAEQNVGCLHDYTLTAKDAKLLNDADVLVTNGAGMEAFVQDLSETAENIYIIDSSQGIATLCDEHSHETEESEHDEAEHSHQHEENAHLWMSVGNAKSQVANIAEGLARVYPEYKDQLFRNRDLYVERLTLLQGEIENASEQVKDKPVVAFHNAYAYLAQDMGFHIAETIESDHGGEPSAKRLAELSAHIEEQSVRALFIEPNYQGSAAAILSAETGVEIYTLNPILNGADSLTAYEDIMSENIEIILKAVK